MRIFWYEWKKIFNIKLLLLLAIFTYFYAQIYYWGIINFPGAGPGSDVYITYISKTLRDEVGMTIHKSEFYLLDEILEDMLKDKNTLIQESEILAREGITNSEEMDAVTSEYIRRMNEGDADARQVVEEINRILFLDGPVANSVADEIQYLYEDLEGEGPGYINFLCDTREEAMASAKKALTGSSDPDPLMVEWLAKFFYTDEMSLLPQWVFNTTRTNFPNLATIMLISVAILILPWQIRERLSGIRDLQGSSAAGRKLWDRQLLVSLAAAAVVCAVQTMVFILAMDVSDMTYYWNYPIYGARQWVQFPFTLGEYVLFSAGMMTLYVLACTVLFHLISRVAANYVVGFALILGPFLILNSFTYNLFIGMIMISSTASETFSRYLTILAFVLAAAVIGWSMSRFHRRKDVVS
ncbi:MAG: hypothetical protein ACLRO4_10470 [Lachnospiraceae bacterium]